ncbi:transcription factor SPT20 homolog, partial [Polistes fuscatus]|uniref:transcription factor SPT20 homolog n=1 Tax=Polistes fuscatus TaxID=30207 RepID=UPI001CAA0E49
NGYSGVPQILQPPRHPAKPFESLKISGNAKPYLQTPNSEISSDFVKDDRIPENKRRPSYDRYQPSQIHSHQSGNFYTQVNHPTNHYKTSYERDPAFLVHESHELSFVTPSSIYNDYNNNFRPSIPYDTLLPPEVYSTSTIGTPSTTVSPHVQETSSKYFNSNDVVREDEYYKSVQSTTIKQPDNTVPSSGITNTYYVSEQQDLTPPPQSWPVQKSKYTSDINEVLPRVNPPNKFSPDVIQPSQLPQVPKMVYVRPQVQQYQSSIVPSQQEYETPESISLKHFNEQQFIIQQQLVQRDRERLAEQERQQQLEIERQQQEELKKHQEELQKLIKQQKEEEEERERQRQQGAADGFSAEKNITDQIEFSKIGNGQTPYTVQFPQYDVPRVTSSQTPIHYNEQNTFEENNKSHGSQIQQPEAAIVPLKTSFENQQYQTQFDYNQQQQQQQQFNNYQEELNNPQQEYVNYRETELQSQKQQKPSRDPLRRKKPVTTLSSVGYENAVTTEVPTQQPETLIPYTFPVEELPTHTTASPEPITFPSSVSTTPRSRTRRPGGSSGGQRRRRPSTTTPEPVTIPEGEYYEKYDEQQQQLDPSRRRRIKPSQQTNNEETHLERRPNIRKRPGNRIRVNHGEPYEAEIVTEIIQTPVNSFRDNTEQQQHSEKYVEDNRYTSNLPNNQYYDYTSPVSQYTDDHRDDTTEVIQSEYPTELTRNNNDKSH